MATHRFIYTHPSGERTEVYYASDYATRRALKFLREDCEKVIVREVNIIPAKGRVVGSGISGAVE